MREHRTWKVIPDDAGWKVREYGMERFYSWHSDQATAIRAARLLAIQHAPGNVVVHSVDGSVVWAEIFSGNGDPEGRPDAGMPDPLIPRETSDPCARAARVS